MEQVSLNNQLVSELSEIQQEAQSLQEIPQRLSECAANCKNAYLDVLSMTQVATALSTSCVSNQYHPIKWCSVHNHAFESVQSFTSADKRSSTATLISSLSEIGASLFEILENNLSRASGGNVCALENDNVIQEQHELLREKMRSTIKSLESSETSSFRDKNEMIVQRNCENKVAARSHFSRHNLVMIFISSLLPGCVALLYRTYYK